MRSFTQEEPTFLFEGAVLSPFFLPHHRKDNYDNEVSEIHFPDIRFDMVHHNKHQTAAAQSATIYAGRDRFVKFNAFYSENDMEEHTAKIITAQGTFIASWGDGDFLRLEIPEIFIKEADAEMIAFYKKSFEGWRYGDNEVLFVMHTLHVIHMSDNLGPYLTKALWEPIKAQLMKDNPPRVKRRY